MSLRAEKPSDEICGGGRSNLMRASALTTLMTFLLVSLHAAGQNRPTSPEVTFTSRIDLVNVNATVLDNQGQFVQGLHADDFVLYEDNQPQTIVQFGAGRVPVSLGIVLDTSASMVGQKMELAERALYSLVSDLFSREDEFFLYGFNDHPHLLQDWTGDRAALTNALARVIVGGNTALFDVVAEAVGRMDHGRNAKKALMLISDGGDNRSQTSLRALANRIWQSQSIVFAVGIDCKGPTKTPMPPRRHQANPTPLPIPFPTCPNPVVAGDLHDITDPTGGRTVIVSDVNALDGVIQSISDELSSQYLLGYASPAPKDGRWHAIRVEARNRAYRVRARPGYVAN
jgi:Ca-activated chloride channel family protein